MVEGVGWAQQGSDSSWAWFVAMGWPLVGSTNVLAGAHSEWVWATLQKLFFAWALVQGVSQNTSSLLSDCQLETGSLILLRISWRPRQVYKGTNSQRAGKCIPYSVGGTAKLHDKRQGHQKKWRTGISNSVNHTWPSIMGHWILCQLTVSSSVQSSIFPFFLSLTSFSGDFHVSWDKQETDRLAFNIHPGNTIQQVKAVGLEEVIVWSQTPNTLFILLLTWNGIQMEWLRWGQKWIERGGWILAVDGGEASWEAGRVHLEVLKKCQEEAEPTSLIMSYKGKLLLSLTESDTVFHT